MHAVREDSDTKIQALLTDSQKQAYTQMKAEMRERMQQKHSDHPNSEAQPNN